MFSVQQKREIADAIQKIIRATNHPELPVGEIKFRIHIQGAEPWSWADIENNGAVETPGVNPWNEIVALKQKVDIPTDYYYTQDFDGFEENTGGGGGVDE